ncbi:alkyl sulfatase C-terminal domain-containing protein [Rhodococcus artemisiae]|uniref:alkyl sulfatase C-terminal domain-containing protein n=1 Tax=Rhodococcus artemisiae TaxID=714159 RepID=UPI002E7C4EA9|nr:alkyl sulfatase C-terminal domain-containing protein [Rhodococcus artemisiae]
MPIVAPVTLTKPQLLGLLAGAGTDDITMDGDAAAISRIVELTDDADPAFPIVTP